MRVYEFLINPKDKSLKMSAISLVDSPAMESQFIAFNKQEKPAFVKFIDAKKMIVAGLALIPNKLVFRVDEATGEEYLGYFSENTIEMIMEKFMADATKGVTKNVNLQHDDSMPVKAHLVESYILRSQPMVDAVKAMGITDATLGSWFVSYKFDNENDFRLATSGEFHGFSIEIMLQRELKMSKNNNSTNKKQIMGKINSIVDKFKTLLAEFEAVTLEDAATADGTLNLRWDAVGTPVLTVTVDEAGVETTAPTAQGEYIIADGRTISVDANGNLLEVLPAVADGAGVPPVTADTALEDELKKKCLEDTLAVSGDTGMPAVSGNTAPIVPAVSGDTGMPAVSGDTGMPVNPNVLDKPISQIVDIAKDGDYTIYVCVEGGIITEAKVEVEQDITKFAAQTAKVSELEAEIVTLKAQLAKPVVKPAFTEFSTPKTESKTKVELQKMSNLDLVKHRLGLDK